VGLEEVQNAAEAPAGGRGAGRFGAEAGADSLFEFGAL
jgi:hypothetical protein